MDRSSYLSTPLETIDVRPRSIAELLGAMGKTGFQGKTLARAFEVLRKMVAEEGNTIFLGLAGSMSTTGQWKLVKWLIENRYVDVLVSTGANVSEDILEAMGYRYYQGSQVVDDSELLQHKIDRYYDVYADELEYRKMERFIGEFLSTLDPARPYSSGQLLHAFGKYQDERGIDSITSAAYRAGVPVFSPGLADSGYGVAAYELNRQKGIHIVLDQFADIDQLVEIGRRTPRCTSVVYVGGGVPKDTIQLVSVMANLAHGGEEPIPHRYAVQITTDSPQWGGLSGCTFEEAISWGKIDAEGDRAVCYCDATIALPILCHALAESRPAKRQGPDLSWVFQG